MLFQEYSLAPCRVYGEFLSFPELSHSQTQHSTDKLIPNFNFLAKTITFLSMFHFLFASMAAFFAGWSFMKKLCSSIESNKQQRWGCWQPSWIARERWVTASYQVHSIGFHTESPWIYQCMSLNVWLGPGYICEYQGPTSDYSIREITLEPTSEDDNELSFASNAGLFIHPSEEELWAILPRW